MKIATLLAGKWEKHPKPILSPSLIGNWDDALVGCPHVWKGADGNYYMSFTGQNYKSANWAIGIAESSDLTNWQKITENQVLSGDKDGWDARIDGAAIFKYKEQYYLFYEAVSGSSITNNKFVYLLPTPLRKGLGRIYRYFTSSLMSQAAAHAENRAIGLAISKDLLKWEKFSGNPVFKKSEGDKLVPAILKQGWDSEGVFSPHIQEKDGKFYMFYGGSDGERICSGIATSKDLLKWERFLDAPILLTGSKGEWDERSVLIVSVMRLEDGWCAFYEGEDNRNNYRIGIAYSYDFEKWEKYGGNPILDIGNPDSFDARIVCSPHIFLDDGKPYLFFSAHDKNMKGSCGVAMFKPNK